MDQRLRTPLLFLVVLVIAAGAVLFLYWWMAQTGSIEPGPGSADEPVIVSSSSESSVPESSSKAMSESEESSASSTTTEVAPLSSSAASVESHTWTSSGGVAGLNPSKTTVAFYQTWATHRGSPMKDRVYAESSYLTDHFKDVLESKQGETMDPVECAEKDPPLFEVVSVKITGNTAQASVHESYTDAPVDLTVQLVRESDMWKIDNVVCPSAESTSSGGRPTAAEGEMCGGIAGIQCESGLTCRYDGNYPDAAGACVSN